MTSARVAAFFDLDKTIIATSSAFAFGKEFLHRGLITPTEALQLSLTRAFYQLSGLSSEQMDTTRDNLLSMVAGWNVEEVERIATDTMHTVVTPVIYAEARELIAWHKARGHELVIVSASASHLVAPIGAELGIDTIIATELEVQGGRFTGEVTSYLKGPAKAQRIRAHAAAHGIDLARSFAYSDSGTDVPMLQTVGNPVAVNPDRALKKHATEHGWPVRTFKNPVPLITPPTPKDVGLGAGAVAAIVALAAAAWWFSTPRQR